MKYSLIYKEQTKNFHDRMIALKEFQIGKNMLLYDSRLKLRLGKLCFNWVGPFGVANIFSYGVVEIFNLQTRKTFKVNGH